MKMVNKILEKVGIKDKKLQKRINVRFPDWTGDTDRTMSIQELRDNTDGCMLIDPRNGEQVDIIDLTNIDKDIQEVIAMPALRGG